MVLDRRLIFIAFVLSLQGLLSARGPVTIKDQTKQAYIPIHGRVFELHQKVTMPPHRTRVFFQAGRLSHGINELESHCQLKVHDISEWS